MNYLQLFNIENIIVIGILSFVLYYIYNSRIYLESFRKRRRRRRRRMTNRMRAFMVKIQRRFPMMSLKQTNKLFNNNKISPQIRNIFRKRYNNMVRKWTFKFNKSSPSNKLRIMESKRTPTFVKDLLGGNAQLNKLRNENKSVTKPLISSSNISISNISDTNNTSYNYKRDKLNNNIDSLNNNIRVADDNINKISFDSLASTLSNINTTTLSTTMKVSNIADTVNNKFKKDYDSLNMNEKEYRDRILNMRNTTFNNDNKIEKDDAITNNINIGTYSLFNNEGITKNPQNKLTI